MQAVLFHGLRHRGLERRRLDLIHIKKAYKSVLGITAKRV